MTPPQSTEAAEGVAPTPLDALPLPLALRIFALLPADSRLLAAAVCRSWRAMLADPALWTRLDLSEESGVANPSNALLRAAAARAGGQLEVLRMSLGRDETIDEVLAALAANAGCMRELLLCVDFRADLLAVDAVAALLRAAPGLRLLETSVACRGADAQPALRKEPPFGPLRLKRVLFPLVDVIAFGWSAVAEGLAAHTSLEDVELHAVWPQEQAESDALVGALMSLPQLHHLVLLRAPASAVARCLGCQTLKKLDVGPGVRLLDSPAAAALLCDALRANTQLVTLSLGDCGLWHDMDAAAAMMAALRAHPSLSLLMVSRNVVQPAQAAAAGAALGALIAHSPALDALDIRHCALGDAGLGPIMDALPRARLLMLYCTDNGMSEAFARERLLPAVRACARLRALEAEDGPAVREAKLFLQQRR